MGDTKSLLDNHEFIVSLARYAEGQEGYTEAAVRKRFRLPDDVWQGLGNDEELVEAIEAEKVRRIRNGASARERAQQLFAKAPDVLGNIMNDPGASARHRIESAKELRVVAANGPEAAPQQEERFSIVINLGNDEKIRIDKPIRKVGPDADQIIEHDDTTPPLLAAIAAKKREDNGSGEPL